MKCEIINIGNELLDGSIHQESSRVAARSLGLMGMKVTKIITVGDNVENLIKIFNRSVDDSDIVILIGGMGASSDDITREAISKSLNLKLEFSRKAFENVARYFAQMGRDVPKLAEKQAYVISSAKILINLKGSSSGQIIETKDNKVIVLLPGPAEEVEIILRKNRSYFKGKFEERIRKTIILHILNMCEAEAADKLKDILETEKHLEEGEIEFYFESSVCGVDITINCFGDNELLVDELLHKTKEEIYLLLKDDIYGENAETLEYAVGRLFIKNKKFLAVAESCTGGLLSSKITDVAGSSIYFRQAAVTYSTSSKIKYLGVDENIIKTYGVVSEEVALQMAEKIKSITGADYAISVTGYAGPAGKEPGLGYICLSSSNKTVVKKIKLSDSRKKIKAKFAARALELLWRQVSIAK